MDSLKNPLYLNEKTLKHLTTLNIKRRKVIGSYIYLSNDVIRRCVVTLAFPRCRFNSRTVTQRLHHASSRGPCYCLIKMNTWFLDNLPACVAVSVTALTVRQVWGEELGGGECEEPREVIMSQWRSQWGWREMERSCVEQLGVQETFFSLLVRLFVCFSLICLVTCSLVCLFVSFVIYCLLVLLFVWWFVCTVFLFLFFFVCYLSSSTRGTRL